MFKKKKKNCFERQSGYRASLVAQSVKNLPAMQETWVRFLGWADPLKKEMATRASIFAQRIPWTEEPGELQSMGSQELDTTWQLNHHQCRYTWRDIKNQWQAGSQASKTGKYKENCHVPLVQDSKILLGAIIQA